MFSLIPWAPRAHFHCIITTLALLHCPFPTEPEGFAQVSQRSLDTGWLQSPTSSRFYSFRPLSQRGTEVNKVKLSKFLGKREMEKKIHILDFHMHCSFLAQISYLCITTLWSILQTAATISLEESFHCYLYVLSRVHNTGWNDLPPNLQCKVMQLTEKFLLGSNGEYLCFLKAILTVPDPILLLFGPTSIHLHWMHLALLLLNCHWCFVFKLIISRPIYNVV